MHALMQFLENAKLEYTKQLKSLKQGEKRRKQELEMFNTAVDDGLKKLMKYYTEVANSTIYVVATFCDPRFRISYFDFAWRVRFPEWYRRVKEKVREYYTSGGFAAGMKIQPPETEYLGDGFDWLAIERVNVPAKTSEVDEYEYWEGLPKIKDNISELKYWREEERFVGPSKMAFELLSIPASSAEVERLFSR